MGVFGKKEISFLKLKKVPIHKIFYRRNIVFTRFVFAEVSIMYAEILFKVYSVARLTELRIDV